MKLMRLAAWVAVFAVIGGSVFAQENMDIRAMQAKLAAQEARLNDLQAKMNSSSGGGTADNVVSLRKNGKVTIGGDINTRYYYYDGEVKSKLASRSLGGNATTPFTTYKPATAGTEKVGEVNAGTLRVSDAKLRVKVDVNDYFEAFIRVDLQDNGVERAFTAQEAYVRWKNVCNSGFSLLVGRTSFVFGGGNEAGSVWTGWYGCDSETQLSYLGTYGLTNTPINANTTADNRGDGMFVHSSGIAPAIIGYDKSRTTQITPSWETQDGKFKAELSLIQQIDDMRSDNGPNRASWYKGPANAQYLREKSINYGLGSGSARLTWKPIEGLKLVGSVVNIYQDIDDAGIMRWYNANNTNIIPFPTNRISSNSTATNLHVAWNPCFLPALKVWGAWTHQWNASWVNDLDADMLQLGLSYGFTDKLSAFGIAEFIRHKNGGAGVDTEWYKSKGWSSYVGLKYNVGYGVNLEAGWRHEELKFKGRGANAGLGYHTKAEMDAFYAHLGFSF